MDGIADVGGGDAVGLGGLDDGDRHGCGGRAQILHGGEQRGPWRGRVDLARHGSGGGEEHSVGYAARSGADRTLPLAGLQLGLVALADVYGLA